MKLILLPAVLASATLVLLGGCVDPGYYGYAPGDGSAPTVIVGDAPTVIAPLYIAGYGTGYWYGDQFWPQRSGCNFYNGRYYGGQNWHGGSGWNGGGNNYSQNNQSVQNTYNNVQSTRTVQNTYNNQSAPSAQRHSGQPHQGGRPGGGNGNGVRPPSYHPVQTAPNHSSGQPRGGSQGQPHGQNKGGEEKKRKN